MKRPPGTVWHRKQLPSRPQTLCGRAPGRLPRRERRDDRITGHAIGHKRSGRGHGAACPTPHIASQAHLRMRRSRRSDDGDCRGSSAQGADALAVAAKIAFTSAGASGASGVSPCRPRNRRSARARLDFRHVADAHHRIVVEIRLLDTAIANGDLAVKRGGEPVHHAAFDLRNRRIGIHHVALIERHTTRLILSSPLPLTETSNTAAA